MKNSASRGAVVPIGFILVISVIAFGLYLFQVTAVPAANKRAELQTQDQVRTQFHQLDAAIFRAGTDNITTPHLIDANTNYLFQTSRTSVESSQIRTNGNADVTIDNAVSSNSSDDFDGVAITYTTTFVNYLPSYAYYNNPNQFWNENGLVYYETPQGKTVLSESQTIVSGKQITIPLLAGDVSSGGRGQFPLNIAPRPEAYKSVTVSDDSGAPITISLDTRVPEGQWNTLLESEKDINGGYVTDITYTNNPSSLNRVNIELETGQDYKIKIFRTEIIDSVR